MKKHEDEHKAVTDEELADWNEEQSNGEGGSFENDQEKKEAREKAQAALGSRVKAANEKLDADTEHGTKRSRS